MICICSSEKCHLLAAGQVSWYQEGLDDPRSMSMLTDPIDWNALRDNCAGDESLVNEVLELFRTEGPLLLADVATAVKLNDANAVKRTAHRLKGALASLAAHPCVTSSRELELMGTKGELSNAAEMYRQLEREMHRLLAALNTQRAA